MRLTSVSAVSWPPRGEASWSPPDSLGPGRAVTEGSGVQEEEEEEEEEGMYANQELGYPYAFFLHPEANDRGVCSPRRRERVSWASEVRVVGGAAP